MIDDDRDLLREYAQNQDASSFAEIAKRHGSMVYGVSTRILRNHQDAQDVTQECFTELARAAGTITTSLGGWLHRVATYRAYTRIRSASRRRVRERTAHEMFEDDEASAWESIAPHVDAALDELSPDVRELVVLHFLEGVTQCEIAERLAVNQSTVSRKLQQGIQQLRDQLQKYGVVAAFPLLASTLAENACAVEMPVALSASLGKMALAGMAPAAAPASSTLTAVVADGTVRLVAAAVAGVLGFGGLVYALWPETPAVSPLDSLVAEARARSGQTRDAAVLPASSGALDEDLRAREARRTRAALQSASVSEREDAAITVHQSYVFDGGGRPTHRVKYNISRAPVLPEGDEPGDDEAGPEAAAAAAGGGAGAGGSEALTDGVSGQPDADASGLASSSASTAGFAAGGVSSAEGVIPLDPGSTFSASGVPGLGGGTAVALPGVGAVKDFLFTDDILWAFTDSGMYGYDWTAGTWINGDDGLDIGTPKKTVTVGDDGGVVVSVDLDDVTRTRVVGKNEVF